MNLFIFIKYIGTVSWKKPGTPYVKEIIYFYIIVFHANSEFQKYISFLLHNYILQLHNIIFYYFYHIILQNFLRSAVTKSLYLQYFNKPIEHQYSVAKKKNMKIGIKMTVFGVLVITNT